MQKCIWCTVHQSIRRISARAGTHPCLNRDAALQKPWRTLGFGCKHGPRGICHSNAALPHPHECTGSQRAPGFCCFIANSSLPDTFYFVFFQYFIVLSSRAQARDPFSRGIMRGKIRRESHSAHRKQQRADRRMDPVPAHGMTALIFCFIMKI